MLCWIGKILKRKATMKSSTDTLIESLKILSEEIHSEDGVVNAAIAEAAQRFEDVVSHLRDVLQHGTVEFQISPDQYWSNAYLKGLPDDEILERFMEFKKND